jgi:hypothetical protein
VAVGVAGRVGGRRGQDPIAGEPFGDGVDARPGEVFAVDALHDRGGDRVGFQPVQALAVGGLGGVRVWSGVGEPVAVGWASAEEAASIAAWAAIADRTRILMRLRSPLLMPP